MIPGFLIRSLNDRAADHDGPHPTSSREFHVFLPLPPPLPLLFSFSKTHRWRVQVGLESLSHFLTSHLGAFSITLALGQFSLLIISVFISLSLQFTGLNFACHSGLTLWQGPWKDHHHHLLVSSDLSPPRPTSTPAHLHCASPDRHASCLNPLNLFMIFHIQGVPSPQSLGQVLSFSTWPKVHPSLQLSSHHVAVI